MKRILTYFSVILIMFPSILSANPFVPPPIITEVYFDEDENWTLEIYIDEQYNFGMINLDSLKINDAIIKDEVFVEFGVAIIISPSMLVGDLNITRLSGEMHVETYDGDWIWIDLGMEWDSTPPLPQGQSIAYQWNINVLMESPDYWLCHNYPPTLGESAYTVYGKGTFHGYIFDLNHKPIPNVQFEYFPWLYPMGGIFSSNDSGYFSYDMYARLSTYSLNYEISDPPYSGSVGDFWISIDSTYYAEIIAPVYLVDVEENHDINFQISSYPNPGKNVITFDFTILQNQEFDQGNIVICELSGKVIEIIPINNNSIGHYKIKWDIPLDLQGIYIYSIELNNRSVTSNKMIITK